MDGRGNRRNAINRRKFKRYIRRRMRRWSERGLMAVSVVLALITVISGGAFLLDSRAKAQEPEFQGAKVIQAFTTESAKEKPAEQNSPLVVLDAGHGGNDQGTCAGDILEKDINLSIVKKLAKKLEAEGATVLLTRDDDFKVGLEGRANIANDAGADFFISIQCNYCEEDAGVRGIESYHRESSEESKALAESLSASLDDIEETMNRGTRTGDYKVLCHAQMPAALVEIGFLSNWDESHLLIDDEYQNKLAKKLAEGILSQYQPEEDLQ